MAEGRSLGTLDHTSSTADATSSDKEELRRGRSPGGDIYTSKKGTISRCTTIINIIVVVVIVDVHVVTGCIG